MRSAVAIVIDGVLRREIGYQPIPEGLALYHVLAGSYNVVLLADQPEEDEELEHFFHVESLTRHSMVYYSTEKDRAGQLTWLRNTGYALDFVVEPDPLLSADLFERGFNVLHFMHAQYARPDWRPDFARGVVPWDELVHHEAAVKSVKAGDQRMTR